MQKMESKNMAPGAAEDGLSRHERRVLGKLVRTAFVDVKVRFRPDLWRDFLAVAGDKSMEGLQKYVAGRIAVVRLRGEGYVPTECVVCAGALAPAELADGRAVMVEAPMHRACWERLTEKGVL